MTKTYNTLQGSLNVRGTSTVSAAGADSATAIVGGYDAQNAAGSVTAGEAQKITNPTSAEDTFGPSELPRAAQAATANGVGEIWGVPVPETTTTESFASSQSLTLSTTPVMNPEVHPEHSITVTDTVSATDLTTNIVYGNSTPTTSDTANVNPVTGVIETDASSDYDVTYTHGDYDTAITEAVKQEVKTVIVCTEAPSVKATLQTELAAAANDLNFRRGIVGARPEIDSADVSTYTPDLNDWRIVEVAPALATGSDGMVRTTAAVGGLITSQPIGPDGSILYDQVQGITALNTEYAPSTAKDFTKVVGVDRNAEVATSATTSTEPKFSDIADVGIIDEVGLNLLSTAKSYAGGPQDLGELEAELSAVCQTAANGTPPLLGFPQKDNKPYDVSVSLGATAEEAVAAVSIVPYPVAETVTIDLTVADGFVEFGGAN